MTTATDKTASNGSTDKPAERLTGTARIREADIWRIASVMEDAATEADRLCRAIYNAISKAYQPSGHSTATELAASKDIRDQADEAYRCLQLAASYLQDLTRTEESPF
jgi:hypothetical protein